MDAQQLAHGKLSYENSKLMSIIREVEKKNCIRPFMSKTLKDNCIKIKDSHGVCACLTDLLHALMLGVPAEPYVTTRWSNSLAAEDIKSGPVPDDDVPEDSQLSGIDSLLSFPQQFARAKILYDKSTLLSIIQELEKKNCIRPVVLNTLKDHCIRIENPHAEICYTHLGLLYSPLVTIQRSRSLATVIVCIVLKMVKNIQQLLAVLYV